MLAAFLTACGPGRGAPAGIDFHRGSARPGLRAERLLRTPGVESDAVRLDRVVGEYLVRAVSTVLDRPYGTGLELESATGERVRLLVDHSPDERLAISAGDRITVRFARRQTRLGREVSLLLASPDGEIRFLAVARAPGGPLSPAEEVAPDGLRPEPTDQRVYLEVLRHESYCTTERAHFAARLSPRLRLKPGQHAERTVDGARYRIHLVDLSTVEASDCRPRPTDVLAYEVYPVGR